VQLNKAYVYDAPPRSKSLEATCVLRAEQESEWPRQGLVFPFVPSPSGLQRFTLQTQSGPLTLPIGPSASTPPGLWLGQGAAWMWTVFCGVVTNMPSIHS
jgi:hypothetical protein